MGNSFCACIRQASWRDRKGRVFA